MSGLIVELQKDALDKTVAVSDLLRKALVVSLKLDIDTIREWIENELNGYPRESLIPSYRKVDYCEINVDHPENGSRHLILEDSLAAEILSNKEIRQSASVLASSLEANTHLVVIPLPYETKKKIMERMKVPMLPVCVTLRTEVVGILDSIRSNILVWSVKLEKEGILGKNMSFSPIEQETAKNITHQTITNIENMYHSQIQQHSTEAFQEINIFNNNKELSKFIATLKDSLTELSLNTNDNKELLSEIITIESQIESPKPKQNIIVESIKSIRSILENITGNVIAAQLLSQIQLI